MKSLPSISISQLRGAILRDVSRSFYLSIRFLPRPLRDPIALAYLLARATDTIADTREIALALRMEKLRQLSGWIQAEGPLAETGSLASFAARQTDRAERTLIAKLPACLAWLHALPAQDRADIRAVLATINEGQMLDVERFAESERVVALATAAELDRYTYLVAGCVGEFWTRICARHLPTFADKSETQMMAWGVTYGKGLQLINILRDVRADLAAGRCYLPAEELAAAGLTVEELASAPARAEPILRAWRERAESGVAAGIDYACAIQSWRVRLATALPALIGVRTLARLRDVGSGVFAHRVKIDRAEVRRIVFTLVCRLAAPATIRQLARSLSS